MEEREHEYGPQCRQECVSLATLRGEVKALSTQVGSIGHDLNGDTITSAPALRYAVTL
jgi:hypothetical protein